jgi:hypothetical protein
VQKHFNVTDVNDIHVVHDTQISRGNRYCEMFGEVGFKLEGRGRGPGLLGCDAVWCVRIPMFKRPMLPPTSG